MGSKIKRLFLLLFVSVFSLQGYSQACGEGTFTFRFYAPAEADLGEMTYKVFKLNSGEEIDVFRLVFDDRHFDFDRGSVVANDFVDKFLQEYPKVEEYYLRKNPDPDGFPYLKGLAPGSSLTIRNGVLQFLTIETGFTPCILQISHRQGHFYIVANLHGGCNRTTEVIIRENGTAVAVIPKDYTEY